MLPVAQLPGARCQVPCGHLPFAVCRLPFTVYRIYLPYIPRALRRESFRTLAHCTIAHCTFHNCCDAWRMTCDAYRISHIETLQITDYRLQITDYRLHITHYTLHITHHTLRIELHITHYTLHSCLTEHVHRIVELCEPEAVETPGQAGHLHPLARPGGQDLRAATSDNFRQL